MFARSRTRCPAAFPSCWTSWRTRSRTRNSHNARTRLMPTLGEILGGIVRDVVHARLLADRLAYDSARAYAADPLLAVFPVPRVGVKEVAVKLSFAISELEEKDVRREAEAEARELWKRELASEILPRLVTDKADPSAVRRATEALAGARTPDFGVAAALSGNPSRIVRDSTSFIAAQIAGLPADVRR